MALPLDDYAAQVAQARRTAHQVFIYAGLSFVAGWLIVAYCIVAWIAFDEPVEQLLDVLLVTGVGSVLGGVALYATSRNLAVSASRLEIDMTTKLGSQRKGDAS